MIEGAKRLSEVKTYYFAKKLREIAVLNKQGHKVINLGIGSPDLKPPIKTSDVLLEGLSTNKAHQYQSYYGLPELRSAFSDFYSRHFKVEINADEEVLPLMGSKEGIMHIAMSFLNPEDEVLIPNPGYPAYKMTTLLAGAQARTYDLKETSDWLPDLEQLENIDLSKVKLMWINYPNMPTGVKASTDFFEKIVAFGHKHNILICHDNPYTFILNDTPNSILQVDGAKEIALELTSLSKAFNMSGWRIGAVLTHKDYITNIIKFKSNMDSGMFKPVQLAAVEALSQDRSWFASLNTSYEKRRKLAWEIFDYLKVSYDRDSAGLFVWGKVPANNALYWSDLILEKSKVFITPGFIFGSNGENFLRISLCSPEKTFSEALARIKKKI